LKRRMTALGCMVLLLLTGCSGNDGRHGVAGTVSLDGKPLEEGLICFRPMPGTGGPSAGCPIQDGRFSLSADKGVFAGKFRVEITASKKTGRKVKEPMGNIVDETISIIPERYNRQSTLTADVEEGGENAFAFTLESQ